MNTPKSISDRLNQNSVYRLVLIIIVLIFTSSTIIFSEKTNMIDYDNACHFYYARFINQGEIPYRDFSLFKTPLYFYVVSFVFAICGEGFNQVLGLNILIGVITILGIDQLGQKIKNRFVGILAATFYALSYYTVWMHTAGKTETLFNLLLVFAILTLIKAKFQKKSSIFVSAFLLSLAFFDLPRASIPVLLGVVLTMFFTSGSRKTALYFSLFLAIITVLNAPFLLIAPDKFILNVIVFNTKRGFQNTQGTVESVIWLLKNGSLALFMLGSLGLLFPFLDSLKRIPNYLQRFSPGIKKEYTILLLSIFTQFWLFFSLPNFAFSYMCYPVWPLLALGSSIVISTISSQIKNSSINCKKKDSLKNITILVTIFIVILPMIYDVASTAYNADLEIEWWQNRSSSIGEILVFMDEQTEKYDSVLCFTPSISVLIHRETVLPKNPSKNPDLINYFPFNALILTAEKITQPSNPVNLIFLEADLREIQIQTQAEAFTAMLNQTKILILEESVLLEHIPEYNQTLGKIIDEKCELLKTFSPDDWISIYRVL